jgi:hypothetical protein
MREKSEIARTNSTVGGVRRNFCLGKAWVAARLRKEAFRSVGILGAVFVWCGCSKEPEIQTWWPTMLAGANYPEYSDARFSYFRIELWIEGGLQVGDRIELRADHPMNAKLVELNIKEHKVVAYGPREFVGEIVLEDKLDQVKRLKIRDPDQGFRLPWEVEIEKGELVRIELPFIEVKKKSVIYGEWNCCKRPDKLYVYLVREGRREGKLEYLVDRDFYRGEHYNLKRVGMLLRRPEPQESKNGEATRAQ